MAMKKISIVEQSLLCASIHINNFKRVIEELVYNSLDAASSSIAIRVCIQENFIQVLDNGNGILKDNFSLLGQKYATSKYVDITTLKSAPDKYGYRGLSLASIIEVSQCVKITSRHENSNDTWMKTFFNSKEKEICKTTSRPSKGSTVEIKGFLYNLNIQRKSIDTRNELQNIKIALQQLSLVHCNVSISLRDDSQNDIILQIHKNSTMHDTIRSVFQISEKDFQELKIEKNEYKVKAIIGKNNTESNNDHQWIYINGKIINKSILHRKLNEKLSKFNTINYKTKNMHDEDGNNYFNSNIPFYYIFITCPFYDYDMNYNSEKSLVEFKDWKEVNKLIEKLIQFYSGGLVTKKQEINKIGNAEKKLDTRTEIKGIMEKILNNKNKPQKISQLQNGVKGKILKRNRKKKKDLSMQRILNNKTETNKPCHSRDYPKYSTRKTSEDKLMQQPINLNSIKDLQMQDLTNIGLKRKVSKIKKTKKQVEQTSEQNFNHQNSLINISRNNGGDKINLQISEKKKFKKPVKTNKKFKKSVKTNKHINFNDSLSKRFESPTKTVRKRIKYLKQRVLKSTDKNIFKEYNNSCAKNDVYSFINNESQYQTITKDTATLSLYKKADENLNRTMSNVYISGNYNKVNNLNYQIVKSYDLIKAVITSQYNVKEYKNTRTLCRQPYEREMNNTYNETDIPIGTYNSHNNNAEAVKRMGYFISEASRNNFFLHDQEQFAISKENNYNKPAKLPVDKSSKEISNCNFLNRYYNQKPPGYSYTIEMTGSHEIINCRSETFHSMNYNLPQVDNHTQSFYFGNTYNLEGGNKRSLYHTDNNAINKTYSLQICNTSSAYYYSEEVHPSEMQEIVDNESNNRQIEKENLIILESESDSTEIMPHDIEPHCHSNELRDFEKEFENTFVNRRDSVTHSDHSLVKNGISNINNDLQQANDFESNQNVNTSHSIQRLNIFTNCKESLEDKVDKLIQNVGLKRNSGQETQSLQIDRDKNHGDKIYSFQIKSRHRFLPKGMSPIADNLCKLQNAYLYNDDDVYYKDMIYTNFANDVLLNTEIFEPEVQNVKNLFSKHIEKVNTDIQKQNADLTFDSLSLMRAKVLGQVDRKFIAVVLNGRSVQTGKSSEFFVLFDQHAVDERVRLENNLSDYIQGSDWKSIDIDPILIVLSKDDYLYLVNHQDKLAQFGLQWTFTAENKILFNAVPKAMLGKNPRQVEIVMKAVKKLISEQIGAIKSLRGNVSLYPKSIMELVFSEACRYAIKFGDKLTKNDCLNMINSLARCKTPFQCAHGRPVMAVLMELKNYSRTYKVNIMQIKKLKKMT
ncbi:DNA mismatch repair protein Mlh3-like [Maniola hyperantus]|uniref:DNA mismatch repair protein Mlh3-like n=1 Tax=Aphantopus hyperantus TaxID=2795564 RepID=UPI003747CB33